MNTLTEREAMKFVLNSRTFDTQTSQTLAISRGVREPMHYDPPDAQGIRYEDVLYRTAKGALFTHSHETFKFQRGKPVVSDSASEMTPEEAVKWIETVEAVVIDDSNLPLPDEA